jgi:festuclavine dehydrogenase
VAAILTKVLGRTITHVSVSADEFARQLQETTGMPAGIAKVLGDLDVAIAGGSEDRRNDVVFQLTGRQPKSFETFAEENKAVWS